MVVLTLLGLTTALQQHIWFQLLPGDPDGLRHVYTTLAMGLQCTALCSC